MPAQSRLGQGAADLIRRKESRRTPVAASAVTSVDEPAAAAGVDGAEDVHRVPVERIARHPLNPRGHVDPDAADLADLAASIAELGVLEPLLAARRAIFQGARPDLADQLGPDIDWVLVAGERRLVASRLAGLAVVPVVSGDRLVTDGTDVEAMIVENIQRETLDPLAEARAYRHLTNSGLSQRVIAKRVGRGQAHVSRRMGLLKLPDQALAAIKDGKLGIKDAEALGSNVAAADIPTVWEMVWERRNWGQGLDVPGAIRVHQAKKDEEVRRRKAENTARRQAEDEGLSVVEDLDVPIWRIRVDADDAEQIDAARTNGTLAVAIDDRGNPVYVDTSITTAARADEDRRNDHAEQERQRDRDRRAAAKARRQVLPALLGQKRTASQVADDLAELILRMAPTDDLRLAAKLAPDAAGDRGSDSAESPGTGHYAWRDAALAGTPAQRVTAARAIQLARSEKRLDQPYGRWEAEDLQFLDRLVHEAGYVEGPFEHHRRDQAQTLDDDDICDENDQEEA